MHLLCRYQRFEKAFLLAADLEDRDLFMVSRTRRWCKVFKGGFYKWKLSVTYPEILFTHVCLKKPHMSESRCDLRLNPLPSSFHNLHGLSFLLFFTPTHFSFHSPWNALLCVWPSFFTGPPFAPCFSNTLNINAHTHSRSPSITPIALVPITSPRSSAAGKPNWKGGVKPVDLERA